MESIKIFDPKDVPFGHLSNNFYYPVWIEDTIGIGKNKIKKWNTVTQYVYAKLLWNPEGQMIIKNQKRLDQRGFCDGETKHECNLHTTKSSCEIPCRWNTPKNIKEIYQEFDKNSANLVVKKAIQKFLEERVTRDPDFALALINTGDRRIVYNSQNSFLGIGPDRNGENLLGKLYEALRYKLKTEKHKKNKSDELSKKDEKVYEIYRVISFLNNEMYKVIHNTDDLDHFFAKYDTISYEELLLMANPKPERQVDYLNKQMIVKNYNKGVIQGKNLIDKILKTDDPNIFQLFKKYNLRQLREILLKRRKFLVFNFYIEDLFRKKFPNIPDNQINIIINQHLNQLGGEELKNMINTIDLLYEKHKLDLAHPDRLEDLLARIDNNIPSRKECDEAEKSLEPIVVKESDPEPEPEKKVKKSALALFMDQFEEEQENILKNADPTDIQRAKDFAKRINEQRVHESLKPKKEDILIREYLLTRKKEKSQPNAPNVPNVPNVPHSSGIISIEQIGGEYYWLSPLFQIPNKVFIYSFYYPTLSHFISASLYKAYLSLIDQGTWKNAHGLLLVNTGGSPEDLHNYKDPQSPEFNPLIYIEEIRCSAMKIFFTIIAKKKFDNYNLQLLLASTGNNDIIYNDYQDNCLGVGRHKTGENFTGKWLVKYREKLSENIKQEAINKQDLIVLGNNLNNDKYLLQWVVSKIEDICQSLAIICQYQRRKNNVTKEIVFFVIKNLFKPCNSLHVTDKYEIYPDSFEKRVNIFFTQYLKQYQKQWDFNKYTNNIALDNNVVSIIWKYISMLTLFLMTKIKKDRSTNPKLILMSIQEQLTNFQEACEYTGKLELNRKQKCIISAIINVVNSFQILDNDSKLSSILINCVGSIIIGKPYKRLESKYDINVFKTVVNKLNFRDIDKDKITKLNILYDYIDKNTTEAVDISEYEKTKMMNRVNFFSSQHYEFNIDLRSQILQENIEVEEIFDVAPEGEYEKDVDNDDVLEDDVRYGD